MTAPDRVNGWEVVRCSATDCQARVVWAMTEHGKRMMVDADPAPGGNLQLTGSRATVPTATVVPAKLTFGRTDLHRSHFATCPNAKQFRRKGGRRR